MYLLGQWLFRNSRRILCQWHRRHLDKYGYVSTFIGFATELKIGRALHWSTTHWGTKKTDLRHWKWWRKMGPQDKKSNTRFSIEGEATCRLRGMTPQKNLFRGENRPRRATDKVFRPLLSNMNYYFETSSEDDILPFLLGSFNILWFRFI